MIKKNPLKLTNYKIDCILKIKKKIIKKNINNKKKGAG